MSDSPRGRGRPRVGPVRDIRIDDHTWARVAEAATAADKTASEWVRDLIAERLAQP